MEPKSTFNEHPTEDLLEEYAFHRLTEPVTGAVEEHLLLCASCQENLRELDEYIFLMKTAAAEYPPTPEQNPNVFSRYVRAAAARPGLIPAVSMALLVAGISVATFVSWRVKPQIPAAVALAAFRGAPESAAPIEARAGGPLDLEIDLADLPAGNTYRIEMVDAAGHGVWTEKVRRLNGKLAAHLARGAKAGVYWVRLYSESGELLREFGMRLV